MIGEIVGAGAVVTERLRRPEHAPAYLARGTSARYVVRPLPEELQRYVAVGSPLRGLLHRLAGCSGAARVFDLGLTVESSPYLLLEDVEGDTLAEFISSEGPLAASSTSRPASCTATSAPTACCAAGGAT
jgi:hypothetical protein